MPTSQRRFAWVGLITILTLILSFFPQVIPGAPVPTASAHNLQTRAVYMFFDPATQACLDARIAGTELPADCPVMTKPGWKPGVDPLLQVGDKVGVIIKVVPQDGTTTGVGGHIDFYVPSGVEVTDVGYVVPNGSGGYDRVAIKGQSPIAIGAGPIGAKATVELKGLNANYVSTASGLSSKAVNPDTGLHRGTIAGLYGDTGIFYSTDPDTAYGSWQTFTGDPVGPCGSLAFGPLPKSGETIVNNSGDTVVPCNKWDAGQLMAWGAKGGTYGQSAPIVDYADGRGNAPWGFASGVAGPESGYAWNFDWEEWRTSVDPDPAAKMREAMSTDSIGPWQRIRYDGDRVSYDQPGLASTVLGYANKDAGDQGYALSDSHPLPAGTNAIRWAVGQLTAYRPEYAWAEVRVTGSTSGITGPGGCPDLRVDTFGGDAGGTDNGKDHLWRYYEPTEVRMNLCLASGKPATEEFIKPGEVFQYPIKVYNLQAFPLTNVVVRDTLGAGLAFQSAVPAQSSGPSPLVWNVGTLNPGSSFAATITVKAAASGALGNCMVVTSDQLPPQDTCDLTPSGAYPYLVPTKTVRSDIVAPGGTVIYDILVKNLGEGATGSPVTVKEYLPPGFAYDPSVTPVTYVNGALVTATVDATNPSEPVFIIPAALAPNKQLTIAFQAKAALSIQPGSYCNTYSVTQGGVPITTGSLACVAVGAGSIGDFVWRDWDGDGMQDAGEEGIAGVTVKLYVDDGDGIFEPGGDDGAAVKTAVTVDGIYGFTGLTAATYWVAIEGGVPADHTLTGDPQGALDGHALVVLPTNGATSDIDFGYQPAGTAVIDGNAYEDSEDTAANDFEPADIRIADVTVNLYEDTNGDGILGAGDLLIATTVTGADGFYEFTGLANGLDYLVDIVETDPDLAGHFAPDAYAAVPGPDGVDPRPVPNLSGASTQDFGYDGIVPRSIGDEVFIDLDGSGDFTAGDTPLANVTVTLYQDTNGNGVIDGSEAATAVTAVTDATGKYLFDGLLPADYIVVVDSTDADIPPGLSAAVTEYAIDLPPGTPFLTADFPFEPLMDKSVIPTTAAAGATLTYTILPKYPGPELLTGAKVTDPIPAGTTYVDLSANAGGEFLDTSDPVDGVLDSIVWALGANSPALAGITPPSNVVFCPATLTVNPEADTFIDEENKSAAGDASGSTTTFKTSFENNKRKHALLRFSLSTLPAGASIESAMLQTTLSADYGSNKQTVQVRNLLAGFAETTATWNDPNGAAAGDWATSGGAFGASDYSATVYASAVVPTKKATVSFTVTDLAKSWQTGPNNGMVLLATGTSENRDANWFSRSGATKPALVIKYLYESSDPCSGDADAPAVADTYINEERKDENKGTQATLLTRNQTSKDRNTLVRFDLSNIPSGATINSVTLQMYVQTAKTDHTDSVFEMTTGGWTETGATWNKKNGATWASGAFSASDYNGTALGSIDPSSTGLKTLSNAALKALVEDWVALTKINSGLVLITTGTGGKADEDVLYTSREGATTANRPKLIVNWTLTPVLSTETRTEVHINDRLHSGTTASEVEVTVSISADAAVAGVSPGSLIVDPGAATVSCGAADPAGTVDLVADVPVTFTYVCSVTPGSSPSTVKFAAKPTSSGGVTFNAGTSEGLRTSPPLTYQVLVGATPPSQIINTATLTDEGAGLEASDDAITAVAPSIGDLVWADLDGDGNGPDSTSNADPGEPGIANVTVWLDDGDGVFEWTDANDNGVWDSGEGEQWTTTDATGRYRLHGLTDGTPYSVRYVIPAGYVPSTPQSVTHTLGASEQFNAADFGLRPPGTSSIGDTLWIDANEDGVVDAGETPIADVNVLLYADMNNDGQIDAGDLLLQTVATDADGKYLFTGVAGGATTAGNYLVDVLEADPQFPAGLELVTGGSPVTAPPASGSPAVIGLHDVTISAADTPYLTADFGYNYAGSIGDRVWWDNNPLNGQLDGGEEGIGNAFVMLYVDANENGILDQDPIKPDYQIAGAFTCTLAQTTDPSHACFGQPVGYYLFDNLAPGKYLVDVYEDSITTDGVRNIVPTTLDVRAKTLAANEDYPDADFGYVVGAKIQGNVFWDKDHNGLFDSLETGLTPVTVYLCAAGASPCDADHAIKTTTTDAAGHFSFLVPEGDYTLAYDTSQTASYPEATTPTSYTFHAYPGEDWHPSFDFGVDNAGVIGDTVYADADMNGVQGAGEPGLADVTLSLYLDADGDPATTGDQTYLGSDVTDAAGKYEFLGLPDTTGSQQYVVKVATPPDGYGQTGDPDEPGALCITCDEQGLAALPSGGADPTVDDTVDFGYRLGGVDGASTLTISGLVWADANGDGKPDTEEPIADVKIVVQCDINDDGTYDRTYQTTTFAPATSGSNWFVAGIFDPSKCIVTVDKTTLAPAYAQTGDPDESGVTCTTSCDNRTTTPLLINDDNTKVNFGYREQLGSISGTVCAATDGNGICEAGENGIPGATVKLTWAGPDGFLGTGDETTATQNTGAEDGSYSFPDLQPGLYQIAETNLPGYTSVADRDGGNPDNITVQNLGVGQNLGGQDFEDKWLASVSGYVFEDLDGDGQRDAGEPGIAGVSVALTGPSGPQTATTNALGYYQFTDLLPGAYTIVETDQTPYTSTGDADGPTNGDNTIAVTLAAGEVKTQQNFGDERPGSIAGVVFDDANNNGVRDSGEGPLVGVKVCATPVGGGAEICDLQTDSNGAYLIPDVPPGDYIVTETNPSGYVSTTPDNLPVSVGSGENVTDVNYGDELPVAGTFSIAGTVCKDGNGNGVCGDVTGETGLPGVTVKLYDSAGALVATTTTDAGGNYTFGNVPDGSYSVVETDPIGYTSVNDADGGTDNTVAVTVAGANVVDKDFVDAPQTGGLQGKVYEDLNLNGQYDAGEPGINGVTVTLTKPDNSTVTATTSGDGVNSGFYSFTNLPPGTYTVVETDLATYISTGDVDGANDNKIVATVPPGVTVTGQDFGDVKLGSIAGAVWDDLNSNGIRDSGEPGIPGVTVCAAPTGAGVPLCVTTNANGDYLIPNVPPGDYVVTETDLPGYVSTTPNTLPLTVGSGQAVTNQNFGDVQPAPALGSISGTVCEKVNGDGVCDPNEAPLAGVTVELWDVTTATLLRTTTTDANGDYAFPNLASGSYRVEEVNPANYTSVNDADGLGNTWDAISPIAINGNAVTGRDFVDAPEPGTIDGKVCNDLNGDGVCGAGEPGLDGVTVTLYDSSGNPVGAPQTTAGGGLYTFPNLPPDTYTVVETDPTGYRSTGDVYGANDNIIVVPLAAGAAVAGQDFADVLRASYTVTKTLLDTTSPVRAGERVKYRIRIENTGTVPITFLPLRDSYDKNFLTYGYLSTTFATPPSDTNANSGQIDWSDLTVSFGHALAPGPGSFFDVVVVFTAKQDTTGVPGGTVNKALVHDALADLDGPGGAAPLPLPEQESEVSVVINIPTGLTLAGFTATAEGQAARLSWQTASEHEIVGFNVLRRFETEETLVAVNDELIVAEHPGVSLAASYAYDDPDLAAGAYTYVLELMKLDGTTEQAGTVSVVVGG